MLSTFERNIEALKNRYPKLCNKLENVFQVSEYQVIDCADQNKTVKVKVGGRSIFLHSKYNPVREAESFAAEKMKAQKAVNILYGFGIGYHVIEMQKLLVNENKMYVYDIEINIFKEAMRFIDLTSLINDERIHLIITGELGDILRSMERVLNSGEDTNVILHVPSVQVIPDLLEDFKLTLEDWNMRKSVDDKYGDLLSKNYISNKEKLNRNVGEFFGAFENIPFLVVSSGPSLDKNIDFIKEAKGKAVIICAGSSLKALLGRGIRPDFFVIIDPQDFVFMQVKGVEDAGIPGIFMVTADKSAVNMYNGPKFAATQDITYAGEGEKDYVVRTGGSVATTALDIAVKMGASPIILVGQDLSFPDERRHAEGYAHHPGSQKIKPQKNMRTVKGQNGEALYTTLGFLSYKRWIENTIEDQPKISFVNASEGGAYIKGAEHISLKDTIYKYLKEDYNINERISNIIEYK